MLDGAAPAAPPRAARPMLDIAQPRPLVPSAAPLTAKVWGEASQTRIECTVTQNKRKLKQHTFSVWQEALEHMELAPPTK